MCIYILHIHTCTSTHTEKVCSARIHTVSCMYMYMHMNVNINIHAYGNMQAGTVKRTFDLIHVNTHTCMHICIIQTGVVPPHFLSFLCTHTSMHKSYKQELIRLPQVQFMYTHMHAYIYLYIYSYTHRTDKSCSALPWCLSCTREDGVLVLRKLVRCMCMHVSNYGVAPAVEIHVCMHVYTNILRHACRSDFAQDFRRNVNCIHLHTSHTYIYTCICIHA